MAETTQAICDTETNSEAPQLTEVVQVTPVRKNRSYSMLFKREAITFAEENSNIGAARKFQVDTKRIREWRKNKQLILEACENGVERHRLKLKGGGKKASPPEPTQNRRNRSYLMSFKREAIAFAEENSNLKAAREFKVDTKRIREWRQNKALILEACEKGVEKHRLKGAGRKVANHDMEAQLISWYQKEKANGQLVSRKALMAKAKELYSQLYDETTKGRFSASAGWLQKFQQRYGLAFREKKAKPGSALVPRNVSTAGSDLTIGSVYEVTGPNLTTGSVSMVVVHEISTNDATLE